MNVISVKKTSKSDHDVLYSSFRTYQSQLGTLTIGKLSEKINVQHRIEMMKDGFQPIDNISETDLKYEQSDSL
jgi:hypothetical protein